MEEVKLFYDSQGINNYICVKAEETISRYQLKMLECNEIPGLLSVHDTVMNGVCKLHYDITKMQRLSDLLGNEIRGGQAKQLLYDILKALLAAEEYLLSFNRCVLHPDYVFIKPGNKVGMVYLPYEDKVITSFDDIREFYQRLLVDYLTDDNDIFFLSLLRYINKQDFSMAGLLEKLEEGLEESPAALPMEAMPTRQQPEAVREEKAPSKPLIDFSLAKEKEEPKKKEKEKPAKSVKTDQIEKKSQADLSGVGFMIPGMENKPTEKEKPEETVPAQNEKTKEKKRFGLFGGGKKASEPEVKTPGKAVPQPLPKAKEHNAPKYNAPEQEAGGGWSGTVMLGADSSPATELLGVKSTAKLIHNGCGIPLERFPFKIGNGKVEVDYEIPKGVISRNHASIQFSQGRYYIKDENSANHTFLNGKQLPPYTEMEIHSGDIIKLANEEMIFQE